MKNPKVGERVVAFNKDCRMVGTICELDQAGLINVKGDRTGFVLWFHPKQCRRLKPKKKPEVIKFETTWKSEFKSSYITTSPTEHMVSVPYLEAIKFYGKRCKVTVEVLE